MRIVEPGKRIGRKRLIVVAFCVSLALIFGSGCSKLAMKERHFKQAERYYAAKEFKKAEIEYLNVLKLERTNTVVVKRLATLYFDQGKLQQAIPFLLGARQLDKDDMEVRIKLAQIHLAARQMREARVETTYVLDRDPKNDAALLLLSDCVTNMADVVGTQKQLQRLQPQSAGRAAWHLAMASLYLRQTNYPGADGALRQALTLEPGSSQAHLAMAMYYWLQKDSKNADRFCQKATELAPLNVSGWLKWAELKLSAGSLKEAREILKEASRNIPGSTAVWGQLARVEFDAQNYLECSNIVQRLLVQDPGNYQGRLLHAGLTRVQGKPADAVKESEELKRVYKGSPEVEFELAMARLRNRERAQAVLGLEELLRSNPNYTQATLLLAELNIGKGDPASAVHVLQNLTQAQPDLIRAQFLLGSAYGAQGRFDEALLHYRGMETRFPTNPAVPFLIGLTLRQQPNRTDDARKAFERASALAANDLLVVNQLVDLDILEKNYPSAFKRVQVFLTNVPKSAGAKFLEARIFLAQTNLNAAEVALEQALEWEPDFGSAYSLLTQTYVAANKLPEALEKLQQMLEKNPRNVRVLMEMGDIFDKKGETARAARTYEDLLKISPNFVPGLNNLAYLYSEKLKKLDEAYNMASRARELAPPEFQPYIADTLGRVHYNNREYSRALALFQESVIKLPDAPDVQYHLGMAYYMMGQEQAARAAFQRALARQQDFPERSEAQRRLAFLDLDPAKADAAVLTSLQNQIRQQPDDLVALLRLGAIYQRTGAPEKARQVYEDARKVNPGSAPVLLQLALLHSGSLKNPQQALVFAKEARKLAPQDPEVAFLLGRLVDQTGDHQWASDLFQESARMRPGNPEVLFHLAQSLYAIGRVNDSEETMRRAAELGPQNPELGTLRSEAQSFLAWVACARTPGKLLEAEPQAQLVLKTRPDYLPAQMIIGLTHEQRGRFSEAKQAYEKILADNPQFAPARKQLAAIYTDRLGDQQKALEQASKARETLVEDAELAKTLGKIAFRRGDFAGAVRFLQESTLKRGQDAEAYYYLGMAHYQLRSRAESKQALDRALSLNPDAALMPELKRVRAELDR